MLVMQEYIHKFDHTLMLIEVIFLLIMFIDGIKSRDYSACIVKIIIGFAVVLMAYELIKYNIEKYITGFSGNRYNSSLCFGAFFIVVSLIIDYSVQIRKIVYENAQKQVYMSLAYTDDLTGLANRRKCDETVENCLEKGNNFTFISMDLNLLKYYNDNYGHEKGDELLIRFSKILKDVYRDASVIARNGGDEFAVLIPYTGVNAENIIKKMYNKISETKSDDITISVAVGIVERNELDKDADIREIYNEADKRMYANKREIKKKKSGR